jgi:hypothetical protein
MKSRNLILLGLVVLVGLGAWQVSRQKTPTLELSSSPLYPGLLERVNEASRLAVSGADISVTVARAGAAWTVEEFDGYPADLARVRRAILQLAELRILEAKTSRPERYVDIGVEDRAAADAKSKSVRLTLGADETAVDLLVGKIRAARAMNAPSHYVRRAGEERAYLVEGDLEIGASPLEWLDTSVVNLPVERVRQVTIRPTGDTAIIVSKSRPEDQLYDLANVPADHEVRARATVSSIGGLLLDARLEKVIRADRLGTQTPGAVATVMTFDGLSATVSRYTYEDKPYVTLTFAHVPDEAITPPALPPTAEGGTPPAPTDALKKRDEVAKEVATLNAHVAGWAYLLPDYKTRLLEKKLEELFKKKDEESGAAPSAP